MSTTIRDYVETLSIDTLVQIVHDQEEFEKQGFIGNCTLRNVTEEIMPNCESSITLFMNIVAMEVYRVLAYRYLNLID